MVKSYLKFEYSKSFGIVTSAQSNIVWSPNALNIGAGVATTGANEEVLCWDIKKGELLSLWKDDKCLAPVTAIAQSQADPDIFAVGYDDGSIRLWDSKIATVLVSFNGHKAGITTLIFDRSGIRLASGSKDTNIVVWDLVAEVGQYKLRGHKDQVTGLRFVEPEAVIQDEENLESMAIDSESQAAGFLLTTGKDSLIKLWDLSSQHCIETHISQSNGECWALGMAPDFSAAITAGNDGELRVWSIDIPALLQSIKSANFDPTFKLLADRGTLHRSSKDRASAIIYHPRREYFAVYGLDKSVEIWRERNESEIKKSLIRKRKRRRERLAKEGKTAEAAAIEGDATPVNIADSDITDIFTSFVIVRTSGKVRSAAWALNKGVKDMQLVIGLTNNQIELYNIPTKERAAKAKEGELAEYTKTQVVELPGHRTDVRSVALSSDDKMLATASNGALKIWNIKTSTCIRTFECGYALCCAFLPGDKVVIVGTKSGELQMFDVASATVIENIAAHEGAIWSLQVHPDGKSVVTGSADKVTKFWNFKIIQEPVLGTTRTTPRLKLVQSRALKVSDDILCVKFSPDAKYLAVALLDNTVKVFFVDSLKLYLNLYGHNLPVLHMDISYDSKLIVTSSADKKIRIWGLDFGDCHKALHGHQDSILQIGFIPHNADGNGHHFFSCSKDRTIKYWDGDKFEQIQRLDGHYGEIWAMAIAHGGNFLITASHDKSIRIWNETDEQIFLEEEREKEIEELYEATLTNSLEKDPEEEGEEGIEVSAATKQTVETLMAGERIVEVVEMGMEDLQLMKQWADAKAVDPRAPMPTRNMVYLALGNISAEQHVMNVLSKIRASALPDALLILPFSIVPSLFTFIDIFAQRSMNIPLTCRVLFFMLKTHHKQIVASRTMKEMMDRIRLHLRQALKQQKDQMGFNIAALKIVGAQVEENSSKDYVDENWDKEHEENVRKRTFLQVA